MAISGINSSNRTAEAARVSAENVAAVSTLKKALDTQGTSVTKLLEGLSNLDPNKGQNLDIRA